jgi:GTP cyclohydrolase II
VNVIDLEKAAARMVVVDRAAGDLRRGGFVVLEGERGVALTQAAEMVTKDSLAILRQFADGDASLALTSPRARALRLASPGGGVVALPLDPATDAETIRGLADPTYPRPAGLPGSVASGGVAAGGYAVAAVTLSKHAQLLPAALTATLPPTKSAAIERFAGDRQLLRVEVGAITDYAWLAATTLRPVTEARVPLEAAEDARVVGFRPADGSAEQFAIVIGAPAAHQPALCRVHSECFTGDLLGSLRCDCGPQLRQALDLMGAAGHGVLIYLAHEGRGIGLINKLRAYQLQDAGLDTFDANQQLGFEPDERSYLAAAIMLGHLGIERVRLLTNNPAKVEALRREGVDVVERVPHAMTPTRHNHAYLATKARRSGHLLKGLTG